MQCLDSKTILNYFYFSKAKGLRSTIVLLNQYYVIQFAMNLFMNLNQVHKYVK